MRGPAAAGSGRRRTREAVATHCALTARYERAAETFEALALRNLQFNMKRFNAKTFYLRAGIVTLAAGDPEHCRRIRRRHKKQDFTYGGMAECQFLEDITHCVEEDDLDGFMDHVYNFNNFIPFNVFELKLVKRIFLYRLQVLPVLKVVLSKNLLV